MSASEMEDLLDEIGSGLGCTPYLDGGAIDRAEAALSKLRAVLSGGSAPQAPDSEELLKALRAAEASVAQLVGDVRAVSQDYTDTLNLLRVANARLRENGHRVPMGSYCCYACDRAALSMKSEGSDPDSSQKGEP